MLFNLVNLRKLQKQHITVGYGDDWEKGYTITGPFNKVPETIWFLLAKKMEGIDMQCAFWSDQVHITDEAQNIVWQYYLMSFWKADCPLHKESNQWSQVNSNGW